jgi:hypothetical protein
MRSIACFIFLITFGAAIAEDKVISAMTYKIDGKTVTEKKFNGFLKSLKQIDGSWYCAETSAGGITGYDAKGLFGARYQYQVSSSSVPDQNEATITKKP